MVETGSTVMMKGVRLIFRNFRGEESKFNPPGTRNFGVVLPEEVVMPMSEDGWNVKTLDPREDDEDGVETPWLPVEARWNTFAPPKITVITTSGGRKKLKEEDVIDLDAADIVNVDLIVRANCWENNGRAGVKAYLQTMFITIQEDPLEAEYSEMFERMDREKLPED